jgi:dTDP-4-amino-4,6-dideoxy-D-galactose acyltransferase
MQTTHCADTFRIERLPWDSAHFGRPVARLHATSLDATALRLAIESARAAGIHLVYFTVDRQDSLPEALLLELVGYEVDRKATFCARLNGDCSIVLENGLVISRYPTRPPSPRLIELAISAGGHSRFRRDPRIPTERFQALYERWITRSTLGEIADLVLVASERDKPDETIGLVTLANTESAASIGLIAVESEARGRGVGTSLLRGSHQWLAARGARRVSVATQLENHAACRLYEKAGYQLASVKLVYHFWPQEHSPPDSNLGQTRLS